MQGSNGAIGSESHNILSGTEPHAPVPGLQKEFSHRFSAVNGIGFELCAGKMRYAPFCSVNPDVPFEIAAERRDPPIWQAVAFRIGSGDSILQPDETIIHRPNPQCARGTFV